MISLVVEFDKNTHIQEITCVNKIEKSLIILTSLNSKPRDGFIKLPQAKASGNVETLLIKIGETSSLVVSIA